MIKNTKLYTKKNRRATIHVARSKLSAGPAQDEPLVFIAIYNNQIATKTSLTRVEWDPQSAPREQAKEMSNQKLVLWNLSQFTGVHIL